MKLGSLIYKLRQAQKEGYTDAHISNDEEWNQLFSGIMLLGQKGTTILVLTPNQSTSIPDLVMEKTPIEEEE